MDRSVKRDIEKRYRKMAELFGGEEKEISCYVCEQCGQVTKVRKVARGMSPGGIECPYCHGQAWLEMFDTFPNVPITHEWYRPTVEEVVQLVERKQLFTAEFVLKGGLLSRECLQS